MNKNEQSAASVMADGTPEGRAGGATYEVRPPQGPEEFAQLARVYQVVFRLADRAAPPVWLMEDTTKVGGLTLGLWQGEDAVGVSYAFPGLDAAGPFLYSDGLGVLPEHRARGQAYRVKLAQREHALERGHRRIVWTFSALRSVNAHLYLSRLGALGVKYVPDMRGAMAGDWGTEAGVPFAEFLIDWVLDSERVRARLAGTSSPPSLAGVPIVTRCGGVAPVFVLGDVERLPDSDRIGVEVAPDYQVLVDRNPQLARDWQEKTEPLFAELFDRGHRFTECMRDDATGRVYYLFEREGE